MTVRARGDETTESKRRVARERRDDVAPSMEFGEKKINQKKDEASPRKTCLLPIRRRRRTCRSLNRSSPIFALSRLVKPIVGCSRVDADADAAPDEARRAGKVERRVRDLPGSRHSLPEALFLYSRRRWPRHQLIQAILGTILVQLYKYEDLL